MLAKIFFAFSFSFIVGFFSAAKWYFLFLLVFLFLFLRKPVFLILVPFLFALGYFYGSDILLSQPRGPFLIVDYPQNYGTFQKVTLKDQEGKLYFALLSAKNKVRVGELIEFSGKFSLQGKTFLFPKIKVIGQKNTLLAKTAPWREKLEQRLKRALPFPEENLLRGLIFGSELEEPNFRQEFQRSGLSHLTAVSGYNLTLITSLISQFLTYFTFLTPNIIFGLTILITFLFLLLMGLKATVIRAVILGILLLLWRKIGKPPLRINLLLLVLLLFLFWQPEVALFEIAFHLSFLSLIGIFYLTDLLPEKLPKFLRETISAQIMALPYLLSLTAFFNPFSVLANALVLPIIPFMMILALISVILPILSLLLYPFLWYLILISKIFSQTAIFFPMPSWLIFSFYLLLGFAFLIKKKDVEMDFAFLAR